MLCGAVAVYAAFLVCDIVWPQLWRVSAALKYAGMLLCFGMALLGSCRPWRRRDARLAVLAMAFTLAADVFLLFTSFFTAGICVFCFAHLCYLRRYESRMFVPGVVLVAGLFAALGLGAALQWQLPNMFVAAGVYAVLIISVSASVFGAALPRKNKNFAAMGMVLFLLCDVNVALYNLLPGGRLHRAASVLMWFFYLPAQALLALSVYDYDAKGAT